MRILFTAVCCGLALAALWATTATAATARAAKLSPAEQKWVKPLIEVWNIMNAELQVVIGEETATNALVAGSGKNNTALTKTLIAFASCSPAVKKAGKLPSVRLTAFLNALESSCTHLNTGANQVAKAIGAVGKGKANSARSYLVKSIGEFKQGTSFLATARKQLLLVGGKNIFKA
jgi:hypothetical protein